jgi:hypothetical protein
VVVALRRSLSRERAEFEQFEAQRLDLGKHALDDRLVRQRS